MKCVVCGKISKRNKYIFREILNDELVTSWDISEKQRKLMNERESMFCPYCNNSMRSRSLAEGIMRSKPMRGATSLSDWVEQMSKSKGYKIAEINYCGNLHRTLSKCRGLVSSEYGISTFTAKIKNFLQGIKHEDIMNLSYKDNSFDLVIHSEVLEHVCDIDKALSECRRILKENGVCVFTVPIIMNRKTLKRVVVDIDSGKVVYLKKPSFHGSGEKDNLVYWEFGGDFAKKKMLKIIYKNSRNYIYVFAMKKEIC